MPTGSSADGGDARHRRRPARARRRRRWRRSAARAPRPASAPATRRWRSRSRSRAARTGISASPHSTVSGPAVCDDRRHARRRQRPDLGARVEARAVDVAVAAAVAHRMRRPPRAASSSARAQRLGERAGRRSSGRAPALPGSVCSVQSEPSGSRLARKCRSSKTISDPSSSVGVAARRRRSPRAPRRRPAARSALMLAWCGDRAATAARGPRGGARRAGRRRPRSAPVGHVRGAERRLRRRAARPPRSPASAYVPEPVMIPMRTRVIGPHASYGAPAASA